MENTINHAPIRMITAGSVDDGKSTLIGRLLYDCRAVLSDQLQSVSRAKHARVLAEDAEIDLSLLTDGLIAEREQGITIDVAYRYFATAERKFILADAPGHEQYTRNLVTGASQSDVAVILVDATRVDVRAQPAKLLPQTKRHSTLVQLMRLPKVVFAVNKMDLVGYDEAHFRAIESAIKTMAQTLGIDHPHIIPMSALKGEGVVRGFTHMAWYQGLPLLSWLEGLIIERELADRPLRLPVQLIVRQDGAQSEDFRGYLGKICAGILRQGQKVRVLPQGYESQIKTLYVPQTTHPVDSARAGCAVAVALTEDLDISRGDLIVSAETPAPPTTKKINVDLCWLDREALNPQRKYQLRINTKQVGAKIVRIARVLDIETLSHTADHQGMQMNDIGEVDIQVQEPILAEPFAQCRATGAIILIDPTTQHTVAAGMIRDTLNA